MSILSDGIEQFIIESMEAEGAIELRRNELAEFFGCVPSQINYVLTTRFSMEDGYLVSSKRGGGGYILVKKIEVDKNNILFHVQDLIGKEISKNKADALVEYLQKNEAINTNEAGLIKSVCDKLPMVSMNLQDYLRAYLLNSMILALIENL